MKKKPLFILEIKLNMNEIFFENISETKFVFEVKKLNLNPFSEKIETIFS